MKQLMILLQYDLKNGIRQCRFSFLNIILVLCIIKISRFFAEWVLVNGFILYGTINYIFRDFDKLGVALLTKTRKRSVWWISKCFWIVGYITICYMVIYLIGNLFSYEEQIYLFSPYSVECFFLAGKDMLTELNIIMLLVPFLIIIVLNLFQMTISVFLKPEMGFLFTFITLMFIEFFSKFMRLERIQIYEQIGLTDGEWIIVILFLLILCACMVLVGCRRFRKYDIMNNIE